MNRERTALTLVAVLVFVLHCTWWWSSAIDDAYITFRYANNFASGRGMAFNAGENLEGITNLGWALLMAPFAGGDMLLAAKVIGVGCGVVTVVLLASWCASEGLGLWAGAAALATFVLVPWAPSLAMQGMETPAAMMLVTLGWTMYRREKERGGVASSVGMALAPWIRPDAALVPILVGFFHLLRPTFSRRVLRGVGIVVVSGACLVALKLHWYGEIVPNTYFVKVTWPPERGILYLGYWLRYPSPVLSAAVLGGCALAMRDLIRRDARALPGLLFVVWLAAVVAQDGDFMINYRLLVPAWPAAAAAVGVLAETALSRIPSFAIAAVGAVAIAPAARVLTIDRLTAPTFVGMTLKSSWLPDLEAGRTSRIAFPIAWIVVNGGRDAVSFTDVGLFGYLFDGPVIDPLGLNDRVIAGREPGTNPWTYLKSRLGYLMVQPESGAWGRYRDALADDGWAVVDGCASTWVFANPEKPQTPPTTTELRVRLANVRARAPHEDWLFRAIARELVHAKAASEVLSEWADGMDAETRCQLGLDGCTAIPIACEDGPRLEFADVADPALWPAASGNSVPISEAPTRPKAGMKCKEALDSAQASWLSVSADWPSEARDKARRAANAVYAPPATSDGFIAEAVRAAPNKASADPAIAATEAARAACKR